MARQLGIAVLIVPLLVGCGSRGPGGGSPAAMVDKLPTTLVLPRPAYPEAARKQNIEGRVVVEVVVGPDGAVSEAKVTAPSGNAELDAAAANSARQARFEPAQKKGRPVAVKVLIPYQFRLDNAKHGEAGPVISQVRNQRPRPQALTGRFSPVGGTQPADMVY